MTRLSIIIPTCGRALLERTLASLDPQLRPVDEVIVVNDGRAFGWCAPVEQRDARFVYRETMLATSNRGATQRDLGLKIATGTHVMFMDDDDAYTDDALEIVRTALTAEPTIPHIFKMRYSGQILWHTHGRIASNNIGTPMFVLPNNPSTFPLWESFDAKGHEAKFLEHVASFYPEVRWHEDIIANLRDYLFQLQVAALHE